MTQSLCNFLRLLFFLLMCQVFLSTPLLHSPLCSSDRSVQFIVQHLAVRELFGQLLSFFYVSCFLIKRENSKVVANLLPCPTLRIAQVWPAV
jgi:hypothetical protein